MFKDGGKVTSNSLIKLNEVTKKHGNRVVLNGISLTIKQGDFIVLRGRNGSGKSTLLKIVSGLIPLTSGQRLVDQPKLVIGYTPDRLSKLKMTSIEYLNHMGKISNIPKAVLQERIKELHNIFKLEQNSNLKMTHFSKGMLQKLNLMQAMLKTPDLLVLDEPFSGLDKESTEQLLVLLKRINETGTSILAAVHDPLLSSQFECRTFWINEGTLEIVREDDSSQSTVYFELACDIDIELRNDLLKLFPDVTCKIDNQELMWFTIMKRDYREFVVQLIHRNVEIISLQRKEL